MSYQIEWQQVDWTEIPIAKVIPATVGFERPVYYSTVPEFQDSDVLEHPGIPIDDLLDLFRDSGFDTDVILQNWFTHRGPTAACTIGFPISLPGSQVQELKKFRRWICRIHVDIRQKKDGTLFSIPHIEIDPMFNGPEHLAFQGQEVYGKTSVELLKMLLA